MKKVFSLNISIPTRRIILILSLTFQEHLLDQFINTHETKKKNHAVLFLIFRISFSWQVKICFCEEVRVNVHPLPLKYHKIFFT